MPNDFAVIYCVIAAASWGAVSWPKDTRCAPRARTGEVREVRYEPNGIGIGRLKLLTDGDVFKVDAEGMRWAYLFVPTDPASRWSIVGDEAMWEPEEIVALKASLSLPRVA